MPYYDIFGLGNFLNLFNFFGLFDAKYQACLKLATN